MLPYLIIGCLFILAIAGAYIGRNDPQQVNPYSGPPYWGDPFEY